MTISMELDTASKMFAIDNLFNITAYIDSSIKTSDIIEDKFRVLIDTFPELKNKITKTDTTVLMEPVSINIKDHYTVTKESAEKFDTYTKLVEQTPFKSDVQWFIYLVEDDENKKYRFYFKMNHAYADGARIIEMVNVFYSIKKDKEIILRSIPLLDTLYYLIIGTLLILYDSLKTFLTIFTRSYPIYTNETDTIRLSFNIETIKVFAKKSSATINDVLYLVMLRADKLYFGEREIVSLSPVKVKGSLNNNLSIITIQSKNTGELDEIHEKFNTLKYSLYIPIISFIINTVGGLLPLQVIKGISDYMLNNIDYVYTNVIGPASSGLGVQGPASSGLGVQGPASSDINLNFQITPRNKEIIFNVISCYSLINITCSFKEGVISDKERYEKCIRAAYEEITSSRQPSTVS